MLSSFHDVFIEHKAFLPFPSKMTKKKNNAPMRHFGGFNLGYFTVCKDGDGFSEVTKINQYLLFFQEDLLSTLCYFLSFLFCSLLRRNSSPPQIIFIFFHEVFSSSYSEIHPRASKSKPQAPPLWSYSPSPVSARV